MADHLFPSAPHLASERAVLLTVGEINALTRRGVWSRLAFSALVSAIACSVISWHVVSVWLCLVFVWELLVRRPLERWTIPAPADDKSDKSLRKLAAVHAFGATIYASLGVLGFLSQTTIGDQLAMGWIAGAAIHSFVYFSNRRPLLLANLAAPIVVALTTPTIAASALTLSGVLSTMLSLILMASASVFATDRNALLVHLSQQINARRAAEEANAAKTEFLKTIGHELRTPLNAVIGYSELLEEDLSEMGADQQRIDASHISAAGKHLLALINDILQLSRQDANAPLLHLDETDTTAVLSEIEAMARTRCAERGNHFVLEASPLRPIILDRVKLTDCLTKLVSNACKHTSGGVITLRVWTEAEFIVFEVTDTGIGMTSDMRANIFQPFVPSGQTVSRAEGGAGLGLAVARKNARLMGGDITVESELGHGSTFTLSLPQALSLKDGQADKAAA